MTDLAQNVVAVEMDHSCVLPPVCIIEKGMGKSYFGLLVLEGSFSERWGQIIFAGPAAIGKGMMVLNKKVVNFD